MKMDQMDDFHTLKRKDLQSLCKKHKIQANLSNLEMANKLTELLKVKEQPVVEEREAASEIESNQGSKRSRTSKIEEKMLTETDLRGMKRKELQGLCKKHKIPANLKNDEMVNRLLELFKEKETPGSVEMLIEKDEDVRDYEGSDDVVGSKKVKKVRFSPQHEVIEFTRQRQMGRCRRSSVASGYSTVSVENVNGAELCGENVGGIGRKGKEGDFDVKEIAEEKVVGEPQVLSRRSSRRGNMVDNSKLEAGCSLVDDKGCGAKVEPGANIGIVGQIQERVAKVEPTRRNSVFPSEEQSEPAHERVGGEPQPLLRRSSRGVNKVHDPKMDAGCSQVNIEGCGAKFESCANLEKVHQAEERATKVVPRRTRRNSAFASQEQNEPARDIVVDEPQALLRTSNRGVNMIHNAKLDAGCKQMDTESCGAKVECLTKRETVPQNEERVKVEPRRNRRKSVFASHQQVANCEHEPKKQKKEAVSHPGYTAGSINPEDLGIISNKGEMELTSTSKSDTVVEISESAVGCLPVDTEGGLGKVESSGKLEAAPQNQETLKELPRRSMRKSVLLSHEELRNYDLKSKKQKKEVVRKRKLGVSKVDTAVDETLSIDATQIPGSENQFQASIGSLPNNETFIMEKQDALDARTVNMETCKNSTTSNVEVKSSSEQHVQDQDIEVSEVNVQDLVTCNPVTDVVVEPFVKESCQSGQDSDATPRGPNQASVNGTKLSKQRTSLVSGSTGEDGLNMGGESELEHENSIHESLVLEATRQDLSTSDCIESDHQVLFATPNKIEVSSKAVETPAVERKLEQSSCLGAIRSSVQQREPQVKVVDSGSIGHTHDPSLGRSVFSAVKHGAHEPCEENYHNQISLLEEAHSLESFEKVTKITPQPPIATSLMLASPIKNEASCMLDETPADSESILGDLSCKESFCSMEHNIGIENKSNDIDVGKLADENVLDASPDLASKYAAFAGNEEDEVQLLCSTPVNSEATFVIAQTSAGSESNIKNASFNEGFCTMEDSVVTLNKSDNIDGESRTELAKVASLALSNQEISNRSCVEEEEENELQLLFETPTKMDISDKVDEVSDSERILEEEEENVVRLLDGTPKKMDTFHRVDEASGSERILEDTSFKQNDVLTLSNQEISDRVSVEEDEENELRFFVTPNKMDTSDKVDEASGSERILEEEEENEVRLLDGTPNKMDTSYKVDEASGPERLLEDTCCKENDALSLSNQEISDRASVEEVEENEVWFLDGTPNNMDTSYRVDEASGPERILEDTCCKENDALAFSNQEMSDRASVEEEEENELQLLSGTANKMDTSNKVDEASDSDRISEEAEGNGLRLLTPYKMDTSEKIVEDSGSERILEEEEMCDVNVEDLVTCNPVSSVVVEPIVKESCQNGRENELQLLSGTANKMDTSDKVDEASDSDRISEEEEENGLRLLFGTPYKMDMSDKVFEASCSERILEEEEMCEVHVQDLGTCKPVYSVVVEPIVKESCQKEQGTDAIPQGTVDGTKLEKQRAFLGSGCTGENGLNKDGERELELEKSIHGSLGLEATKLDLSTTDHTAVQEESDLQVLFATPNKIEASYKVGEIPAVERGLELSSCLGTNCSPVQQRDPHARVVGYGSIEHTHGPSLGSSVFSNVDVVNYEDVNMFSVLAELDDEICKENELQLLYTTPIKSEVSCMPDEMYAGSESISKGVYCREALSPMEADTVTVIGSKLDDIGRGQGSDCEKVVDESLVLASASQVSNSASVAVKEGDSTSLSTAGKEGESNMEVANDENVCGAMDDVTGEGDGELKDLHGNSDGIESSQKCHENYGVGIEESSTSEIKMQQLSGMPQVDFNTLHTENDRILKESVTTGTRIVLLRKTDQRPEMSEVALGLSEYADDQKCDNLDTNHTTADYTQDKDTRTETSIDVADIASTTNMEVANDENVCGAMDNVTAVMGTIQEYIDSESSTPAETDTSKVSHLLPEALILDEERSNIDTSTLCIESQVNTDWVGGQEDVSLSEPEYKELLGASPYPMPVNLTTDEGCATDVLVVSQEHHDKENTLNISALNQFSTAKKNTRAILIHGTPRKPPVKSADLKENVPLMKNALAGDITQMRPAKRRALQDI